MVGQTEAVIDTPTTATPGSQERACVGFCGLGSVLHQCSDTRTRGQGGLVWPPLMVTAWPCLMLAF